MRKIMGGTVTVLGTLARVTFRPKVAKVQGIEIVRLGSAYGGWTLLSLPSLHGATVLSCGLGEDASFDVEIAARYMCNVVVVDPTPRAVAHFAAIQSRLGHSREQNYVAGGCQPVTSYELGRANHGTFRLVESAIWTSNGTVPLYFPQNSQNVSLSVDPFFSKRASTPIQVPCVTLLELQTTSMIRFPLIKLDIETAEMQVVPQALADGVAPDQWLVEFDALSQPGRRSLGRFKEFDEALCDFNYVCVNFDRPSNFTYVKRSIVAGALG